MNPGLEAGAEAAELIAALRPRAEPDGLWRQSDHAKGSTLFTPADDHGDIFILLQGLVKLVYVTPEGQEWIKSFIVDRGLFAPQDTDGAGIAQGYAAVCLEPSRIVRLPRRWVEAAVRSDPAVGAAYIAFAAFVQRRKQAREEALLCLSAEAHYRALRARSPEALQRLPKGDVARYLGITPVAFSRILRRSAPVRGAGESSEGG